MFAFAQGPKKKNQTISSITLCPERRIERGFQQKLGAEEFGGAVIHPAKKGKGRLTELDGGELPPED